LEFVGVEIFDPANEELGLARSALQFDGGSDLQLGAEAG